MKHFPSPARGFAWLLFLAVLCGLFASPGAYAQSGLKIHSITIQYNGPETINRQRILAQMRTAVGQNYSDSLAEKDIRALYATGRVQNVRIYGEPDGDGVKVIVAIQTRGTVGEIEINGATKISARALRKKIKLKVNAPLDEDALGTARQDILDDYRGKGFTDVDVQYTVQPGADGMSRVVFTINEGEKGAISQIRFEGNQTFSSRILRKQMKTKGKTLIAFLDKSGRLDEAQFQQDLDAIREWYQNHGYIDVEVKDVRRERSNGHMTLVVVLSEGQKYHVGHIYVKGTKVTTEQKVRLILKMKDGDVYSPQAIRDDAKLIADGYGAGGYVDLVVQPQGSPSGPQRIDITYTIEEGHQAFVQRINITGNTRTKDKVIRREISVTPGDIFSTTRVEISKKRLDNLGYFSRVETFPDDTGVPGRKDLTVQVEEKRTGSLNFGAGFSTIDSIVGFVEVAQGNFDILNWPTFTGGGQKFRARVQYGAERKDIVLSLTEPYFLDRRLSLGGDIYYREASFLSSEYNQRNYGFSIVARKGLTRFLSLSTEYRLEEIDIFDVASNASAYVKSQAGALTKSQITTSLVYDTRDNPFITRTGRRIGFTPFVSGGFLGGDIEIFGGNLEGSQYWHLPYDMVLLLNGELATVDTWAGGNQVPIYDKLYLGGANNLRGFAFREVGPKDDTGEPIGGQTLVRGTVELTYPLLENDKARLAVFFDAGFIEPKPFNLGGRLASDAGIGLRLNLPVGPLRLDYAIPVQSGGNSTNGHFNFNVGYQF